MYKKGTTCVAVAKNEFGNSLICAEDTPLEQK